MTDLVTFLRARLDEDEARADQFHHEDCKSIEFRDFGVCDCGHPARVLREVEAGRAILDRLDRAARYRDRVFALEPPRSISDEMRAVTTMMTLEAVVKLRAAVYSDHPDYRQEWKP